MKYNVHMYAVVRVKVFDIEADSQQDAMYKADADVDLSHAFDSVQVPSSHQIETGYADEITGFLVDEVGDEEYRHTRDYNREGNLQPNQTPRDAEKRTI